MGRKVIDITGKTFGAWTVKNHVTGEKWLCQCVCGRIKELYKSSLLYGLSLCCGCLNKEKNRELGRRLQKFSLKHGKTGTPEYRAWQAAKNRCYNSKLKSYKDYGGRGITVCERWLNSFENFLEDIGERPSASHSLERINVNGNYSPDNCRWATKVEQAKNTRRNIYIEINGELKVVSDLCKEFGVLDKVVYARIATGWDPLKAVSTPSDETIAKRVRNNKAKGRALQNWVRDSLAKELPSLQQGDIKSQIMGMSGIDIELSPAARELFPFSIECKNYTKITKSDIKLAIKQSTTNKYTNTTAIVVFRQNSWRWEDTLVVCPVVDFVSNLITLVTKDKIKDGNVILETVNEKSCIGFDSLCYLKWKEFLSLYRQTK